MRWAYEYDQTRLFPHRMVSDVYRDDRGKLLLIVRQTRGLIRDDASWTWESWHDVPFAIIFKRSEHAVLFKLRFDRS